MSGSGFGRVGIAVHPGVKRFCVLFLVKKGTLRTLSITHVAFKSRIPKASFDSSMKAKSAKLPANPSKP